MAKKKLGSVKNTDEVVITACDLANDVTGTLPVTNGGTGQTTYTNGQLLIGNTTGNTLTKATLTQGANMAITNGTGSITVATSLTPTFDTITQTYTDTSSTSGTQYGINSSYILNTASAHSGAIYCAKFSAQNSNSSGTLSEMVAVHGTIENVDSGTIGTATAFQANCSKPSGTINAFFSFRSGLIGTVSNYYGLYIEGTTAPTNIYGIVSGIAYASNRWNLYISGTANNAIAGNVSIGSTTAPSNALDVTGNATISGSLTVGGVSVGNVTGQSSSVDSEIALFSGTGGKTIKRATTTGILKASSGVLSAASSGTDYVAPGSATTSGLTMSTSKLLGRTTASSGAIEEITVGTGLTLSSGTLTTQTVCTSGTVNSATGVTEHAWTSIPSGTKVIFIAVSGLSTSGTSQLIVQLGDSGGYETSGYSGTVETGTGRVAHNQGFYMSNTTAAAFAMHGLLTLTLLDSSTNLWSISGSLSADASTTAVYTMGGSKALSATLNSVRITTVGGTDTIDGSSKTNITYFG